MRTEFSRLLAYLAFTICFGLTPAQAQDMPLVDAGTKADVVAAQPSPVDEAKKQLQAVADTLDEITKKVQENADDDQKLADLKLKSDAAGKDTLSITVSLRPRLDQIKSQLTALGEPPKGTAEDPTVTAERERLTKERAAINALGGEAENLSIRATKLSNQITEVRRALFTGTLVKQTEISPEVFKEAAEAFVAEKNEFLRSTGSWIKFTWSYKRLKLTSALFFSALVALVLVALGYRMFDPLVRRDPAIENPPYISRLSVAFWSTVIPSLSMVVFATASYFLLYNFNALRPDIAPMVEKLLKMTATVFFIYKLTRSVLAPFARNWRVFNVSDHGARLLTVSIIALAIVNGLDYLLGGISEDLGSPVVLTVVKSFISAMSAGLILIATSFVRPMRAKDAPLDARGLPWPRFIRFLLVGAGLLLIISASFGFVGFARFASTQIVMTGAVLVTMYIGLLTGRGILSHDAFSKTFAGNFLRNRFGLSELAIDQTGLAAGLGIYFIAFVIGIPLILIQWNFQPREIWNWVIQVFTEISIGRFHISLVSILVGVMLFFGALAATRWFQRWFDGNVLTRSTMDVGVRNSVRTGLGYVGVALAGLIGISSAGIDLSNLALVAGALSLGIGFGLQNIVSNFVSGLILLVERPFKVGDWVVTGTTEGFVRQISVRATEIETFQHQSIIVPNSELINASVGNWTHKNRLGRTEIPIGVSYSSDPRRVMEILLEIGNDHPKVLKNPEPFVAFVGFGDSSLDFELRVHMADIMDVLGVRTDLRLAIFERFREENIEIPFPQRDLNIKFGEAEGAETFETALSDKKREHFTGNPDAADPENLGGLKGRHVLHSDEDEGGDGDGESGQ